MLYDSYMPSLFQSETRYPYSYVHNKQKRLTNEILN